MSAPTDIIVTIDLQIDGEWIQIEIPTDQITSLFSTALYKNKAIQAINIWPIVDADDDDNAKDLIYDLSLAKAGAFPWRILPAPARIH